jgi:hypothetical protein
MPARYLARLTERRRTVTPLRVLVGAFLAAWWGTALLSGYRAVHQIREVGVGATGRVLLPGTRLSGSVATSGRTEGSLTLELVQGAVRETLAVVYLPRNRDAPMDPRSQRGRISVVVTPATIERFRPGAARLRATGLGSAQWLRVPPPTVREVEVEIPAVGERGRGPVER